MSKCFVITICFFIYLFIRAVWLVMWVLEGFFLFLLFRSSGWWCEFEKGFSYFSYFLLFWSSGWWCEFQKDFSYFFIFFFLSSGWWCECQKWSRPHRSTGSCVWPDVWKKENASEIHFCQVWKYFEVLIYANTLIHGALCFNLERLSSVFVF